MSEQNNITPIGYAILDLLAEYERALDTEYVNKPIAYALYQTWKKYDVLEKSRNGDKDVKTYRPMGKENNGKELS